MRDEFSEQVKRALANRVANLCSRCGATTCGAHSNPDKALNVGVAAHTTAASPNGPRYDKSLTRKQRSGAENGVWLCQTCGKLADNDPVKFTVVEMRAWKQSREAEVVERIGQTPSRSKSSGAANARRLKKNLAMKRRVEHDPFDNAKFRRIKICKTGRIPWRNIVDYHTKGDEYYNCPHVCCIFGDIGEPYEDKVYYTENYGTNWPLNPSQRFTYDPVADTH